ncbi:hypothetical protein PROFUN_16226, partial [Planoprotostelium fungivorum]
MQVAIAMCSEADEEDLEEGELTAHKSASQLIDMITTRIPSNATFQPIMEILPRYIKDPSPDKRRAAITVLSVMCEGCADKMINPKYLSHELQWVCSSTTDQDVNVREASIVCLGHFSKFLQPEIMEFSSTVLPLLFQGINDSDERVIKASCYSLEAFCSDLSEEEIAPYVDGLVGRLTGVISSTKNKQLQELALSALSSTAAASGVAFINYAPSLLPPLISFMELSDADHIQLRCTATECVGLIAASIGKDAFAPYLNRTVALALDGCKSDYEELREYTYSFFCNIAELLLLDFKVYIPEILPFILKSITSEDGIQFDEEEQEESIISDDEEEGGGGALHVRTAFLQEKSAACHAIGVFAKCAGGQYILESRYIDHVASAFAGVREYFHEDVKVEVDSAEKEILLALHKASGVQYVPCAPVVSQPALHNNVVQYMDVYLPAIIERITKDVDKEVVGNACGCIGAVVAELGPRVLEKYMSAILDAFTMITSKKTMSQQDQEDEEGEEDEQFEMEMIVCAFDMIVSISKTLRADMLPYFQFICNAIAPYQRSESENYRSAAVGLLAEMCNAMGSSIAQYVPQLIEVSFKGMQDESAEVRSNSTFFCGVLLQHAGIAAHNYYPRTLEMLSTSIDDDSLPNIIDNSCGALCRMIMTAPHLVPLGQVLPTLMDHLPLRRDMEENTTVYKALFHLYNSQDQALMAVLPKMISCFGRASATPLEKDLFEEMQRIIKSLAQQHPQAFEAGVEEPYASQRDKAITPGLVIAFLLASVCADFTTQIPSLTNFFQATNGSNWTNRQGWFGSDDPCDGSWYGIACQMAPAPFSYLGMVANLSLSDNNLVGQLLQEAIPFVVVMNLSRNDLTGHISSLSFWFGTVALDLSQNQLTGQLPDMSGWGLLQYADLSANYFFGTIQDTFSQMRSLAYLDISVSEHTIIRNNNCQGNTLSGGLPASLAFDNQIESIIPQSLCMTSLQLLDLSNNLITGEIPLCIGNLIGLRLLTLSSNNLVGDTFSPGLGSVSRPLILQRPFCHLPQVLIRLISSPLRFEARLYRLVVHPCHFQAVYKVILYVQNEQLASGLYLMATSNETLADQITDAITAANPADKKVLHGAVDQALKDAARSTLREWAAAGDITTKFDEIRAYKSPNAPAEPLWGSTGLSRSSSHSGEAKLDKILEMMIEDRQERKSIPFSKITAGKITDALEGHIYRKPEVFKTDQDRIKSKVDPFTWITGRASPSETAQTPEVLKWFQRNIKPVGGFKWRDVSQGVSMRLPIGGRYYQNSIIADITVDYVFKGKTDLQLSEGDEVDTAIMIVQLKKTIMCQIETLAACRLSMYPVVGVLTDTENWVFYWMGSQNILNYHKLEGTIDGVNLALSVIHNFVKVQERRESGDNIPFTFPPRISKEHMDRNMDLLPDLDIRDQMAVFRDYYERQLSGALPVLTMYYKVQYW